MDPIPARIFPIGWQESWKTFAVVPEVVDVIGDAARCPYLDKIKRSSVITGKTDGPAVVHRAVIA